MTMMMMMMTSNQIVISHKNALILVCELIFLQFYTFCDTLSDLSWICWLPCHWYKRIVHIRKQSELNVFRRSQTGRWVIKLRAIIWEKNMNRLLQWGNKTLRQRSSTRHQDRQEDLHPSHILGHPGAISAPCVSCANAEAGSNTIQQLQWHGSYTVAVWD